MPIVHSEENDAPATTEPEMAVAALGAASQADELVDVEAMIAEMQSDLSATTKRMEKGLRTVKARFKELLKVHNKLLAKKRVKGEKKKAPAADRSGDRAPSGFARPCLVSDTLAAFVGAAPGTRIPRTDVTKSLNAYVNKHNLKNPDNKREVVIDAALADLTGLDVGHKVSMFGMQTHLKQHYLPDSSPLPDSGAPVPSTQ